MVAPLLYKYSSHCLCDVSVMIMPLNTIPWINNEGCLVQNCCTCLGVTCHTINLKHDMVKPCQIELHVLRNVLNQL